MSESTYWRRKSMRPPKYRNPAGRILATMERLSPEKNKAVKRDVFAKLLGVEDSWPSILDAIDNLRIEFQSLVRDIDNFPNPGQQELFRKALPAIERSITKFIVNMSDEHVTYQIVETGLVAIEYISAALPQEDVDNDSNVEKLQELVSNLQTEIAESGELTPRLKEWLLELVRLIRDSLDRYVIRGGRGIRRELALMIGELELRYMDSKDVKDKVPSIWLKVVDTIDTMYKTVSIAEKAEHLITSAQDLLPYVPAVLRLAGA